MPAYDGMKVLNAMSFDSISLAGSTCIAFIPFIVVDVDVDVDILIELFLSTKSSPVVD